MTYFADLTAYTYGFYHSDPGPDPDLNVGWLQVGHPFPTAEPEPEFVRSLIRCCRRSVRLYRGIHVCNLCDVQTFEMCVVWYEGRRIHVGNGEVRVAGPDGRWYTAPTLVAHYVLKHKYSPPEQFVSGVLKAAATIPCIDAQQFSQIAALSTQARFNLCIDLLVRGNETLQHPWVTRFLESLNPKPQPAPVLSRWSRLKKLWQFGWGPTRRAIVNDAMILPGNSIDWPPRWMHDVARNAYWILLHASPEETLEFTAAAIECSLDPERDYDAY